MMRSEILKGTGPTALTKRWFADGDVVDAGDVSYTITDAFGTSVASGTAAKAGSGTSTTYTISIPVSAAAEVAELSIEWTRTDTGAVLTDTVSIVGAVLFTEADARAFKVAGGINPLSDTTAYTDQSIAEARYRISELLESRTGVSLVPRYARALIAGTSTNTIQLRHAVRSHGGEGWRHRPAELIEAEINSVALTAGEISNVQADPDRNTFTRFNSSGLWSPPDGTSPPLNISIGYRYGLDIIPWEAHRASLTLLLTSLVPSDVSSRASSFSNEDGTFRLNLPSLRTPTGIPAVDEFVAAYDHRPLFA